MDHQDGSFVANEDHSLDTHVFEDGFFVERFQWLYEHVRDPKTGDHFSDATLAARLADISSGKVNPVASTIWNLRNGKTTPKWMVVVAIAKAFGRSPRFFTDPNFAEVMQHSQEEAQLIQAMKRTGVRNMMLRAAELPDESIASLTAIVDQIGDMMRQRRDKRASEQHDKP